MHDVSSIHLTLRHFRKIQLQNMTRSYRFLLSVCRLIFKQLVPTESAGEYEFRDFVRDDAAMARIFERFVLNFYRREQRRYKASARTINWQDVVASESDRKRVPQMKFDILLRSRRRTIIIDTKYYPKALASRFGKSTIRPQHLFQLFSYLNNYKRICNANSALEGLLLYPTVNEELRLNYVIHGFPIRVITLNLNQPFDRISSDLLGMVSP
jgi:5-methylcytosine-specific restriction enzyme subunit McrC